MAEKNSPQTPETPDKSELVAQVMDRHDVPSYEAWAMTVAELTAKLED